MAKTQQACTLTGVPSWKGGWFDRLMDIIYPIQCLSCEVPLSLSPYRLLCAQCLRKMKRLTPENSCRHCGLPLGRYTEVSGRCSGCRTEHYHFTQCISGFLYDTPIKEVIHAMKFADCRRAVPCLGGEIVHRLYAESWMAQVRGIVPVPLSTERQRERGFNQAEVLASVVADMADIPLMRDALKRTHYTRPQVGLSREERLRNPQNAFEPKSTGLGFETCILIDDIMTTGATLSACAVALREGGVKRIYAAVVARTP